MHRVITVLALAVSLGCVTSSADEQGAGQAAPPSADRGGDAPAMQADMPAADAEAATTQADADAARPPAGEPAASQDNTRQGTTPPPDVDARPDSPTSAPEVLLSELPASGPLRVAADGSGHVTRISDALLAAGHEREIRVAPGTYHEALRLDHRVFLVADGGPVIIDGGAAPAVSLEAQTQVVLRGLTLRSSLSAASVSNGQLVLEECQLVAGPGGTALRTTAPKAQLVLRRCRVDAGAGTALQLHMASSGEISDCAFSWEAGNARPLLVAGSPSTFVVWQTSFGWRRQGARALLSDVLAVPMPTDGRMPVTVQPQRERWPAWAVAGQSYSETIGEALAAAAPGLRIDIAPGSYDESLGLRQATHLRALGEPGSVVVRQEGAPCLWFNGAAGVVSTVRGLTFEGAVAERTATVQVNGGQLELIDCRVANPAGHGVVATSSWDACELVLLRSEIDCAERGLFATGQATRARINQSQLRSRSVALFAVEGAQVSMQGGRIQADSVGVELWGVEARVSLTGCHMGATPHMVRLAKGATRSQLTSEQLVFEPAQPSEPAQSGGG